jgi:formylglycine-generating enzyme required for sulfatase activity
MSGTSKAVLIGGGALSLLLLIVFGAWTAGFLSSPAENNSAAQTAPATDTATSTPSGAAPAAPPSKPDVAATGSSAARTSESSIASTQSATPQVPARVKAMLQSARAEFDQNTTRSDRFTGSLRAIAAELPEVTVTTGEQPLHWNTVSLNQTGIQLDAFRFRSPLSGPADMHWVFVVPEQLGTWYILPVNDSMSGFRSFQLDWNIDLDGGALPPGNTAVFQPLLGGQIRPGTEYIVWYAPPDEQKHDMKVAIRLSPAGAHGDSEDLASITKALGAEVRYQAFEASQDGLRSALRTAHSMVTRQLYDTEGFRQALRSVLPVLHEVRATEETGQVHWNHITPSESFQFQAVRFKSPLDVPADLQSILVVPDEMLVAGIVPAEGHLPPMIGYQLGVNVAFTGASLPPDNLAIFQNYGPGLIEPGREYIYWFMPNQGALPDVDLALHFTAASAGNAFASASDIARAFGLTLPEPPATDQVAATFQRCRNLVDAGQAEGYEFMRLLDFVLPTLPELELSRGSPAWNELKLNQQGNTFAAFRFTSPADGPADFEMVVAKPNLPKTSWAIAAPIENQFLSGTKFVEEDLDLPEIELPADNVVIFESTRDSRLPPGSESVLYFAPAEPAPFTVKVALRVTDDPQRIPPSSARAIAVGLGITLPVTEATPGSKVLAGHKDAITGLTFSPDGTRLASCSADGSVRLWDPAAATVLQTLDSGHGALSTLAISRDGTRLATAAVIGRVIDVWDLETMKPIASITWRDAEPQRLALSANGSLLAACDQGFERGEAVRDSWMAVWEVEKAARPRMSVSPDDRGLAIEFMPEGNTLVIGGTRKNAESSARGRVLGLLQFFDCSRLRVEHELTDEFGAFYALALSGDGSRLVAANGEGYLKSWDTVTRKPLAAAAVGGEYPSIAISAGGEWVASGSSVGDGSGAPVGVVRISAADSLRTRRVWLLPKNMIRAVAISPDGRWAASADTDATIHLWDAAHVDQAQIAGDVQEPLTDSVGIKLMPIPPGEFDMGTPDEFELWGGYQRDISDERPQHHVRLTRAYYLSAHEVTVGQFRQFVDSTAYRTTAEKSGQGGMHLFVSASRYEARPELNWRNPGFPQDDTHPVVQVSWDDAMAFCKWLSEKEGAIYRLPSEAEWEYACRAGIPAYWSFGSTNWFCGHTANVADASLKAAYGRYNVAGVWNDGFVYSAPVGSLLPNGFGLYDMHGNVYEWCSDWYNPVYYSISEEVDPAGPQMGKNHVQRSGSFFLHNAESRSADRDSGPPDQAQSHLGFRVVREIPQ